MSCDCGATNRKKCKECGSAYARKQSKLRYARRREMAIKYLGSQCAWCFGTEDLQIVQKDFRSGGTPAAKVINSADAKLFPVLDKCQLMCPECKEIKFVEDQLPHRDRRWGAAGCRCGDCTANRRKSMDAIRKSKPL